MALKTHDLQSSVFSCSDELIKVEAGPVFDVIQPCSYRSSSLSATICACSMVFAMLPSHLITLPNQVNCLCLNMVNRLPYVFYHQLSRAFLTMSVFIREENFTSTKHCFYVFRVCREYARTNGWRLYNNTWS